MSKLALFLGLFLFFQSSQAHTLLRTVNGASTGILGLSGQSNSPLAYTDTNIVCNTPSPFMTTTPLTAAAGSTVTLFYQHETTDTGPATDGSDKYIAGSHYGPFSVYMTPVASNGLGLTWSKIHQESYDPVTGYWPISDLLKKNQGQMTFQIPSGVSNGVYYLRPQFIALHAVGSPQFYVSCIQVQVTGGSSSTKSSLDTCTKESIGPSGTWFSATDAAYNLYSGPVVNGVGPSFNPSAGARYPSHWAQYKAPGVHSCFAASNLADETIQGAIPSATHGAIPAKSTPNPQSSPSTPSPSNSVPRHSCRSNRLRFI